MKISNCCGVRGDYKSEYYDPTFQQLELCPKCGEHCEYITLNDNKMNTTTETPKNCAFQYAKMKGHILRHTDIVCDKTGLTLEEAKELWDRYYSDCAKWIKDGGECEMVIWVNMVDDFSFDEKDQHISTDAESDGTRIWETTKTYFKKYSQ